MKNTSMIIIMILLLGSLYFFTNESVKITEKNYNEIENALNDLEFEIKFPMYLGDVNWDGANIIFHDEKQTKIEIYGVSDNGFGVTFMASLVELEKPKNFNWEEIKINNNSGLITRENNIIQWIDKGVSYSLDGGDLNEEELLKIAESLG
ncbi:DUF4367 domain-containing protein [Bacillus shivajii]|uniref:DUF4367 domain-containing protein n=1 Tax=Bacillus shivajii TaxID=1983719 RepID=UPI001CF9D20D|nr:DUF4367 domain-containing protein [Bacillus shivajii]UCZ54303.1 DUF4367 domain-containing protein [Bacillus shivajii]